jgi:hypothetical protein
MESAYEDGNKPLGSIECWEILSAQPMAPRVVLSSIFSMAIFVFCI